MRNYMKWFVMALLAIILMVPTIFVIITSIIQMQEYDIPSSIHASERSYGNPVPLTKQVFVPVRMLDGVIKSESQEVIAFDTSSCNGPVVLVREGEEVLEDEPIVECENAVFNSPEEGIISDISTSEDIVFVVATMEELVLEVQIDIDAVEDYQMDMSTDTYVMDYLRTSMMADQENRINVVYGISGSESLYINQSLKIPVNLSNQEMQEYVVIKEAVFMESGVPHIRVVTEDGEVLGDREIVIISEDMNQYAIRFVRNQDDPIYVDIEYGVYMNRLQGNLGQ